MTEEETRIKPEIDEQVPGHSRDKKAYRVIRRMNKRDSVCFVCGKAGRTAKHCYRNEKESHFAGNKHIVTKIAWDPQKIHTKRTMQPGHWIYGGKNFSLR